MGLNITLSYKKLCIKILLVFFFGFPFFIYMVLRLFLTLEIMSHTNQLVCTNSQVLTNVVYRLLESLYRLSPRDDTREEYKTFGPAIGMVLTFVLNEDWEKTKSTKNHLKKSSRHQMILSSITRTCLSKVAPRGKNSSIF